MRKYDVSGKVMGKSINLSLQFHVYYPLLLMSREVMCTKYRESMLLNRRMLVKIIMGYIWINCTNDKNLLLLYTKLNKNKICLKACGT